MIRAGDVDGLGRIYSEFGGLILRTDEILLAQRQGCDVAAYGSWRIFFPRRLFHPLPGRPSGTVYLTSDRLIFIRNIDIWREVKPLLTPLGLPAAAERESKLKGMKAKGARQYCEVLRAGFKLMRAKRKPGLLHLRLARLDNQKYEVFVYVDKDDPAFFDLVERTLHASAGSPP